MRGNTCHDRCVDVHGGVVGSGTRTKSGATRAWTLVALAGLALAPARVAHGQPVVATWLGGSGAWNSPANWSTNPAYPNNGGGTTYVAVLPTGTGTVTLSGGAQIDRLDMTGSGSLLYVSSGTLNVVDRCDIATGATIRLDFGTIQGGTLNVGSSGAGLKFFRQSNSLSGVTINGLVVNDYARAAGVTISNGLTLNGTWHNANAGTFMAFGGTQSVTGNGTIVLDGPAGDTETGMHIAQSSIVTFASGMTIRGGNASVSRVAGGVGHAIINEGRISADINGRALDVYEVDLNSTGTLEAINGGTLRIGTRGNNLTTWTSSGLLRAAGGSALELGGTFTLGSGSSFDTSGGAVSIVGNLENAGSTLALNSSTGSWSLRGAISGGNVTTDPGRELYVPSNASLSNVAFDGSLRVHGGRLIVNGGSVGGAVVVQNGGTLDMQGTWTSNALVEASDATVNLGGTFTLQSGFTTQQANSQINLIGMLNNAGHELHLGSSTGSWNFGGTIVGGTLRTTGGAQLLGSGTLDGVTLGSAFNASPDATITVRGGLTGGAMNFAGSRPILRLAETQQLSGTSISLLGTDVGSTNTARVEIMENAIVTTGAATTIRGGRVVVENRGRLINYGVIQADVPGEVLTLQAMVPMPNNFENYGELRAINGGTLFIPSIAGLVGDATVVGAGSVLQLSTANANAQPYTLNGTMNVSGGGRLSLGNHPTITGTINATTGSSVSLGGNWANQGTINVSDSTLDLGGVFTPSSLGTINRTNSNVRIAGGSFDLQGGAFTVGVGDGPNQLAGGLVGNGTLNIASGASFDVVSPVPGSVSSLEFLTLNGAINVQDANLTTVGLTIGAGSQISLHGSTLGLFTATNANWSNNGVIHVDTNSTLNLGGSNINLSQVGTVQKTGNAQVNLAGHLNAPGQTVTISPTSLLTGIAGGGRLTAGTLALASNPTLRARYASSIFASEISGTGTIVSESGEFYAPTATTSMTIGSGVTLRGAMILGRLGSSANPSLDGIVNQGTIICDDANFTTFFGGGSFSNTGTIEVAGGDARFYGTYNQNPPFRTQWSNSGTIRVTSGTLSLGGAFSYGGLGTIDHQGGRVVLDGQMDLTGHSATFGSGGLNWEISSNGTAEVLGGTVSFSPGYRPAYLTLNGSTLQGDLAWTDGPLYIRNGFSSTGTITLQDSFTSIRFRGGNQTIASGTFDLGSSNGSIFYEGTGGANITFGPSVVVRGSRGGISGSNLTNQGLISANAPGSGLSIGGSFTNQGTVEAINAGTLAIGATSWVNSGTVRIGVGSTMTLRGMINAGGTILNQGGTLTFQGLTQNNGATLTIDAPTGSTRLQGGIQGGTILVTPGSLVDTYTSFSPANLSGVSLHGNLRVPNQPGAGLVLQNGVTLNGTIQLLGGEVRFMNSQTLTGGTVALEAGGALATRMTSELGTTVTLGPGTLVRGSQASLFPNVLITQASQRNALVNQGRISADVAGGLLEVAPDTFTNAGVLEAINGATLRIGGVGAGNDPTHFRERRWSNTGTIRAINSNLSLGGHFDSTVFSQLELENASVTLTGGANNTGRALDFDGVSRSISMESGGMAFGLPAGGRIIGGSANFRNGAQLLVPVSGGGVLDGATIGGDVVVGGTLHLVNGAQLTGTTTLNGGTLNLPFVNGVPATQTIMSGTVVLAGSAGQYAKIASDDLVIGADAVVRGGNGMFQRAEGSSGIGHLVNYGRITADVAGQTIYVGANGSFANFGTVEALNGATLALGPGTHGVNSLIRVIDSTLELNGGSSSLFANVVRSNATIRIGGRLENSGRTLNFDADSAWSLNNGLTLKGGIVNIAAATGLPVGYGAASLGGVTLDGVTFNGNLVTTPTFGGLDFYNGVRINGTLSIPTPQASLEFFGSQTVHSGDFFFDPSGGVGERTVDFRGFGAQGAGTIAVTLGPDVVFRGGDVALRMGWGTNADTLINQGLISADQAGKVFAIDQQRFVNQGTVRAINGGIIRYDGPAPIVHDDPIFCVNSGSMLAGLGSVLQFDGLQNEIFAVLAVEVGQESGECSSGLIIADAFEAGGMLSIVVSPGYMPRVGDRWEVLRLGVRRGAFGGVDTPELGDSLWWDTSRLLVDGSVSIVPSPGAAGLIVMAGSLLCARRRRA